MVKQYLFKCFRIWISSRGWKTGWTTIYGLIRGLQVELGITPLVDNFGSTTAAYYDAQITPKWGEKLSKNVVYLIQGALV